MNSWPHCTHFALEDSAAVERFFCLRERIMYDTVRNDLWSQCHFTANKREHLDDIQVHYSISSSIQECEMINTKPRNTLYDFWIQVHISVLYFNF